MTTRPVRWLMLAAVIAAAITTGCSSSSTSSKANGADKAFVAEMIPHHRLAVQMAQMAQTHGQHPEIKSLANNITASQNREIAEMTTIAPTIGARIDNQANGQMTPAMGQNAQVLGISMDAMGMAMNMAQLDGAKPFDRAFIDMMTPHHQGAIAMAKAELAKGQDPRLRALATSIIADQTREISQMSSWRIAWFGGPVPPGAMHAA